MSLTKEELKELKNIQEFIEILEEGIIYQRQKLKQFNTHFRRMKKRAKELLNKKIS